MDQPLVVLLPFLFILLWPPVVTSTLPMAKPHCSDKCGNVTVPYPFGFGAKECYRADNFGLICNGTHYNPPKLFAGILEVLEISLLKGQMRVMTEVSKDCYNSAGSSTLWIYTRLNLKSYPGTFSDTENRFTVLGCDTKAYITGRAGRNFTTGCNMICTDENDPIEGSCSGVGCCQTSIPKGFKRFRINIGSFNNHSWVWKFNPCSYAFLVDINWYHFSVSNLSNFRSNIDENGYSRVPMVLDWSIEQENGSSCEEARKHSATYACGRNSDCYNSTNGLGYNCKCSQGYHGNPYLLDGCQDINECVEEPTKNNCTFMDHCINLPGNYSCSCPHGYRGDGRKDGTGCRRPPYPVILVTVGSCLAGSFFLLIGSLLVLYAIQKRKDTILKQKFFTQNGGFLLKQQLSSHEGLIECAKIYKAEQLKHATNNYDKSQILGQGGYGTVYRGVLPGHRTVAIKKSKIVDPSQIGQFINEVVILSQLNHRNVVRLLGCCLETEVPILVYEFVANETLFYHIHGKGRNIKPVSWDCRLRIATETSEALAYLHSIAWPPIIHRDIKSANILLDDNLMAKVADFGASRLVPRDKTHISTFVQGTVGYLDPEYYQTGQLTEKSDVYSFGIVLAELLTGKTAFYIDGSGKETCLGTEFPTLVKEGKIWDIIDDQIVIEGCKEQLQKFMELIERCLEAKVEKRPKMKEVEMVLQWLRRYDMHPLVAQNPEEVECLLGESSDLGGTKTIDYNSMPAQEMISLNGGR